MQSQLATKTCPHQNSASRAIAKIESLIPLLWVSFLSQSCEQPRMSGTGRLSWDDAAAWRSSGVTRWICTWNTPYCFLSFGNATLFCGQLKISLFRFLVLNAYFERSLLALLISTFAWRYFGGSKAAVGQLHWHIQNAFPVGAYRGPVTFHNGDILHEKHALRTEGASPFLSKRPFQ